MKKQTKKLTLNKKTISNLTAEEMGKHVGGSTSCNYTSNSSPKVCGVTYNNAKTCHGHNTCYNC
jgi:natural product precursor